MSKSNVNPNHYKVSGRERQGEDILQARHKQKHAQSLVRGRSAPHVRRERPALIPGPPPPGAAPLRTTRKTANTAAKKESAAKRTSTSKQGSDKRGTRSTAQKRASSRYDFDPIPATSPVGGASGKAPSARRRKPPRE